MRRFNYKTGPGNPGFKAYWNPAISPGSDFSRLSLDRADGPDNSLWRQERGYTPAGWQRALPASGAPVVRLVNPEQSVLQQQCPLDAAFWQ